MIAGMPEVYADSVYTLRNNGSHANMLLRTPSQKNGFERVYTIYVNVGIPSIGSAEDTYLV